MNAAVQYLKFGFGAGTNEGTGDRTWGSECGNPLMVK